jgi:erythromycin esterase-like protein
VEKSPIRGFVVAGLIALVLGSGTSTTHATTAPAASDMDLVVREVCGKTVALLGEAPMHGYGKTLEFKVELVRRLVDECHYNAFFIESGIYDFLHIQKQLKSGQPVTAAMITAAIGGLWANREMEPLIPFLLEKAQRGAVMLGGFDDQLGRGTYAQQGMPADLVEYLQGDAKPRCLAILQRHTLWQYTNDAPYSASDKALIVGCLDSIKTNVSKMQVRDAPFREQDIAAVESLKRSFARDFREGAQAGADPAQDFNARDRSMYTNFQWLMARLPPHSKVIVWTATNHAAKDLSGVPGQERMVSLGSNIQKAFKDNAFVLGFTANSGSYALGRQPVRQLSVAPSASLEGQAFTDPGLDTRYFNLSQLRAFGAVQARPLGADFKIAKWDQVLDGLVVFREERPPVPKSP